MKEKKEKNMNKNVTEMIMILDRSGSMSGLENDTIGGYNALLVKQKTAPGRAFLSTILFDDRFQVLHDRVDVREVKPLTDQDYYVRGTTALLDAIGRSIIKVIQVQKSLNEEEQAGHVIFVITTDGHENASVEYSYKEIKTMIERQKKVYGWEFIFLGANIDAVNVAERVGIRSDRSANYHSDSKGTNLNYEVLSDAIMELRTDHKLSENWKSRIDKDFQKRTKN
jgi:uncharacterized protein YegL